MKGACGRVAASRTGKREGADTRTRLASAGRLPSAPTQLSTAIMPSRRAIALLSQRDALLNEIALMRARRALPALTKATTLLTRFWAMGDWGSRGEILRAARVFVSVGKMQSVMGGAERSPEAAPRKRKRRLRARKRLASAKPRKASSP